MTMLLERDEVLADLTAHLDHAVAGRGRLLLLHGEAGVGKTSVLQRFTELVGAHAGVLRGWCDPLSTPRPMGPWLDVADGLGVRFADGPEALTAGLRLLLEALSAGSARVLVFEDVHWADAASLDLLRLLARRIDGRPVLLVASYRDDEIGPAHPLRMLIGDLAGTTAVTRLGLEPLSPAAVARLAGGQGLDAEELYRVTGGNPFFVTEVLTSGGGGIPETVADAVAARLARVSPPARRVADLVAVLGSPAPQSLITELVADTAELISELVGAGVVHPTEDGVAFRHELARMAVLDAMPGFERTSWHAAALERLRAQPGYPVAVLAHHAEAAGDSAAVLRYAPAAATEATASGAHREAAAQYQRALRFGGDLPVDQRAELTERFALASGFSGRTPEAMRAFREAAELRAQLGDRLREGHALRHLSSWLYSDGHYLEARRVGQRAVEVLEASPPSRELAWAHVNGTRLAAYNGLGVELAEHHAQRAVELGDRLDDAEAAGEARVHLGFARYCASGGEGPRDGWADLEHARDQILQARFTDTAVYLTMLMVIFPVMHRDWDRADAAQALLERLSLDRDLQAWLRASQAHRALGLLHRGHWDGAVEMSSLVVGRPATRISRLMALTVLGLARARRGDPEAAEPLDEATRDVDLTGWLTLSRAARAEDAWLSGDVAGARAEAECGLAALTPHSDPWVVGELTRWLVLAGGQPPPVRVAEPYRLELAGDWRAAAAVWDRLQCPYDAALARLTGDVPAVMAALESFRSLGARPAAERARARLRDLGVRPGVRGPRSSTRADAHGLTARQREILKLVAEGLTDSQIAARLHLSAKTVNNHVGAILTKLDVHTRADAVRKLASR